MSAITPRSRPSARVRAHIRSNVVGYVAVFIALSGSAYAIDGPLPGQNQVGSADIIDQEVKQQDLGSNTVATGKIIDGDVGAADLGQGSVASAEVSDDSLTKADLDGKSVGAFELDGSTFRSEDIRAQFVGFGKAYGIPTDAIQSDEISDGTIQPADLANEAKGPLGFEFADNDTGIICNNGCVEGSLALPPGFYMVFGKIEVDQDDVFEDLLSVRCDLTDGGGAFDHAFARQLGETGGGSVRSARATLPLQGHRLLLDTGRVSIECTDFDQGDAVGLNLKLNAIKLGAFGIAG
jgi:hypothetical protein